MRKFIAPRFQADPNLPPIRSHERLGGKPVVTMSPVYKIKPMAMVMSSHSSFGKPNPGVEGQPTSSNALLGFGNTKVHVFSWDDLRQTEEYTYFPPRLGRSSEISTTPSGAWYARVGNFQRDAEWLGRLTTNIDSSELLLEIAFETSSGQSESQYLLFDIEELQHGDVENGTPRGLLYQTISPDIASRIREPLGVLPGRRLVFLSVGRWICTWWLPTPRGEGVGPQGRSLSEMVRSTGIEQFIFFQEIG